MDIADMHLSLRQSKAKQSINHSSNPQSKPTAMAYVNRPYGNNYYEAEREVVREGPYGSYAADYSVDEYGNRIHHHRNGLGNVVTEIVSEVPAHHHHHHQHLGVPGEIIERREERIVDAAYDPYRRMY